MKVYMTKLIAAAFISVLGFNAAAEAKNMNNALDARQQSIVAISAYAGVGNMNGLRKALAQGLESGLTINEIKEMVVQVYAYAGYPRSINAAVAFQEVVNERKAKGINDAEGRTPSPMPTDRTSLEFGAENQTKLLGRPIGGGIYDFVPLLDQFLKAHLFGDIFQRDNLDWKSREFETIAILAGINGAEPQLEAHLGIGMRNGITEDEMRSAASIIGDCLGREYETRVNSLFDRVLKN